MKPRAWTAEDGGWSARSVLECGGPPPHLAQAASSDHHQSARGLAQSKTWRLLAAICLLTSAFCHTAQAQYAIDWFTLDSGGGASVGGGYTLTGTIGQPDAGQMSGGGFTLRGGFWGIVSALPTDVRPPIEVRLAEGAVTVSWPSTATGYLLDQTPTLSGTPIPWTQAPFPYQTNATRIFITVPAPSGTRFYQLRKPVQL